MTNGKPISANSLRFKIKYAYKSNDTFYLKVVLCPFYTTGKVLWFVCILLCGCASNFGFKKEGICFTRVGINTTP
jgi:hypothetical protein